MEIFLILYLVILSICDCREKKVPIVFLYLGVAVAIILSVTEGINQRQIWLQILGWMPGAVLVLVAFATKKAGYADGIVLAVTGAVLGYRKVVMLFCISLVLVSAVSVILLLLGKVNGRTRIPYLPFVTAAFLMLKIGIA